MCSNHLKMWLKCNLCSLALHKWSALLCIIPTNLHHSECVWSCWWPYVWDCSGMCSRGSYLPSSQIQQSQPSLQWEGELYFFYLFCVRDFGYRVRLETCSGAVETEELMLTVGAWHSYGLSSLSTTHGSNALGWNIAVRTRNREGPAHLGLHVKLIPLVPTF